MQSFTVAAVKPSEVRLSPDGSKLYSAGDDGVLRVYSLKTGALIDSWQVGTKLGGMDISPDGSFLMVVERRPLSTTGSQWDRLTMITVYKVDTTTGQATSHPYQATGYDYTFFDVSVLSDGKALLSQNFSGSGGVQLKLLDPATSQYNIGPYVNQSSVFSRSATGATVLIGEPNSSGGPLDIYQTGNDTLIGFDFGEDLINLPITVTAFSIDTSGTLDLASFDADLAAALGAFQAARQYCSPRMAAISPARPSWWSMSAAMAATTQTSTWSSTSTILSEHPRDSRLLYLGGNPQARWEHGVQCLFPLKISAYVSIEISCFCLVRLKANRHGRRRPRRPADQEVCHRRSGRGARLSSASAKRRQSPAGGLRRFG